MKMLGGAGFRDFAYATMSYVGNQASHPFVLGLMEWFWDATNTFHFPWGEMMITPFDFQMLTGLSFTDTPVEVNTDLKTGTKEVRRLLGPAVVDWPQGVESVKPGLLLTALEEEGIPRKRRARLILLLLINSFLVPDSGADTRCHLRYLASLDEPSEAGKYDWGGLGYAQLLLSMRKTVRQRDNNVNVSIAGPWRVIEVFALNPYFLRYQHVIF